ncbi:MAG: hypothetical protein ACJATN_000805, partial [Neolewinella sp.]
TREHIVSDDHVPNVDGVEGAKEETSFTHIVVVISGCSLQL